MPLATGFDFATIYQVAPQATDQENTIFITPAYVGVRLRVRPRKCRDTEVPSATLFLTQGFQFEYRKRDSQANHH